MTTQTRSDAVSGPTAKRRGWLRRLGSAALVGVLALGACSDDDPPESTTPQGTVDESSALTDFVLAEQSVGSIAAFEGVVATPFSDTEFFENPDPRGPCGGESPPPPLEGTAGAVFAGSAVTVVQVVAEGPEVDEFFDAQLADIEEPCGPYQSTTDVESAQQVDEIAVTELPDGRGFFLTGRIVTPEQTAYTGSGLVRNADGITSLVFAVAAEPIPTSAIESLVLLADAELRDG